MTTLQDLPLSTVRKLHKYAASSRSTLVKALQAEQSAIKSGDKDAAKQAAADRNKVPRTIAKLIAEYDATVAAVGTALATLDLVAENRLPPATSTDKNPEHPLVANFRQLTDALPDSDLTDDDKRLISQVQSRAKSIADDMRNALGLAATVYAKAALNADESLALHTFLEAKAVAYRDHRDPDACPGVATAKADYHIATNLRKDS